MFLNKSQIKHHKKGDLKKLENEPSFFRKTRFEAYNQVFKAELCLHKYLKFERFCEFLRDIRKTGPQKLKI